MAFNRIVDRAIDARNPRTAQRELPAGKMGVTEASVAVAVAGGGVLVLLATAYDLGLEAGRAFGVKNLHLRLRDDMLDRPLGDVRRELAERDEPAQPEQPVEVEAGELGDPLRIHALLLEAVDVED